MSITDKIHQYIGLEKTNVDEHRSEIIELEIPQVDGPFSLSEHKYECDHKVANKTGDLKKEVSEIIEDVVQKVANYNERVEQVIEPVEPLEEVELTEEVVEPIKDNTIGVVDQMDTYSQSLSRSLKDVEKVKVMTEEEMRISSLESRLTQISNRLSESTLVSGIGMAGGGSNSPGSGEVMLSRLDDVTISLVAGAGDALVWNGSDGWTTAPVVGVGGAVTGVTAGTGISITGSIDQGSGSFAGDIEVSLNANTQEILLTTAQGTPPPFIASVQNEFPRIDIGYLETQEDANQTFGDLIIAVHDEVEQLVEDVDRLKNPITDPGDPNYDPDLVLNYVSKDGDTMSGPLVMDGSTDDRLIRGQGNLRLGMNDQINITLNSSNTRVYTELQLNNNEIKDLNTLADGTSGADAGDAVNRSYVQNLVSDALGGSSGGGFVNKSGDTMSGRLRFIASSNEAILVRDSADTKDVFTVEPGGIISAGSSTSPFKASDNHHIVTRQYAVDNYLTKNGGTLTGRLVIDTVGTTIPLQFNVNGIRDGLQVIGISDNVVSGVDEEGYFFSGTESSPRDPQKSHHLATKNYIDDNRIQATDFAAPARLQFKHSRNGTNNLINGRFNVNGNQMNISFETITGMKWAGNINSDMGDQNTWGWCSVYEKISDSEYHLIYAVQFDTIRFGYKPSSTVARRLECKDTYQKFGSPDNLVEGTNYYLTVQGVF